MGVVDEGNRLIQFEYDGIFEEILDQLGQMHLPPYITHQLKDKNRYQTVYAKPVSYTHLRSCVIRTAVFFRLRMMVLISSQTVSLV